MQVSETGTEIRLEPFSDFVSNCSAISFAVYMLHVLVLVTTITPSSSRINYRNICSTKCNFFKSIYMYLHVHASFSLLLLSSLSMHSV